MAVYINIKESGEVETIDEFETYKEAKRCWKSIGLRQAGIQTLT